MSLSAARRRDGQREIDEIQKQIDEQKRRELDEQLRPVLQEQEQLFRDLRAKEQRETKKRLVLERSDEFDAPLFKHKGETPAQISANIARAYQTWLETDGASLSDQDKAIVEGFLRVNSDRDFDLGNVEVWKLAQEFVEQTLNAQATPAVSEQEPTNPRIPTGLISEPAAETEPEGEAINPHRPGTREHSRWDAAQMRREAQREQNDRSTPVFHTFIQRIENETGHLLTPDEQRKLISFQLSRNLPPEQDSTWMNVLWQVFPDYVPESEQLTRQEAYDRDHLPMESKNLPDGTRLIGYLEKYGLKRSDTRSGKFAYATRNVTR